MSTADYARIEKAIRYLDRNFRRQPNLKDAAREAGLSEYHFHRLFSRWAGITPKRFLQFLTAVDTLFVDQSGFHQGAGGTGLNALPTGHTGAGPHGIIKIKNDL